MAIVECSSAKLACCKQCIKNFPWNFSVEFHRGKDACLLAPTLILQCIFAHSIKKQQGNAPQAQNIHFVNIEIQQEAMETLNFLFLEVPNHWAESERNVTFPSVGTLPHLPFFRALGPVTHLLLHPSL